MNFYLFIGECFSDSILSVTIIFHMSLELFIMIIDTWLSLLFLSFMNSTLSCLVPTFPFWFMNFLILYMYYILYYFYLFLIISIMCSIYSFSDLTICYLHIFWYWTENCIVEDEANPPMMISTSKTKPTTDF